MVKTFKGFPGDMPEFLWGIALNNDKAWFEARRDVYERVIHGPIKALAEDVTDALTERYPELALRYHISRIYRDARTLNGRGPLNDHLWFSIGRTARVYETETQFYFGIDARGCDWGVGCWNVRAADMERWRAAIDADPRPLERIVKKLGGLEGFEFAGGIYKKPKGDPGETLYDWYNARRVVLGKSTWFEPDTPGPELCGTLIEDYSALVPLYRYLEAVLARPADELQQRRSQR